MKTLYLIALILSIVYLNACAEVTQVTEDICKITQDICEYANAICMLNQQLPSSQQIPEEDVVKIMSLRDNMRAITISTQIQSKEELMGTLLAVREKLRVVYKNMQTPALE